MTLLKMNSIAEVFEKFSDILDEVFHKPSRMIDIQKKYIDAHWIHGQNAMYIRHSYDGI